MSEKNGATFVRITNRDVFDKLTAIDDRLALHLQHSDEFERKVNRQLKFGWGVLGAVVSGVFVAFLWIVDKISGR